MTVLLVVITAAIALIVRPFNVIVSAGVSAVPPPLPVPLTLGLKAERFQVQLLRNSASPLEDSDCMEVAALKIDDFKVQNLESILLLSGRHFWQLPKF